MKRLEKPGVAAALPRLGPARRAAVITVVPMVSVSRVYVGTHLRLDIAGGAALGIAVDAAVTLIEQRAGQDGLRCSLAGDASRPAADQPEGGERRGP